MAISATTDWSKIRYVMLYIFAIFVLLASNIRAGETTSVKHKRQLFREHVLPEHGGKIPDTAFQVDRLALNRLNSHGLYTTDGINLEYREPARSHHHRQYSPNTIKVPVAHADHDRYVAPSGRYHYPNVRTIDTTYLSHQETGGGGGGGGGDSSGPATSTAPIVYTLTTSHLAIPHHALPRVPYHSLHLAQYYKRRNHAYRLTGNHLGESHPGDAPTLIFEEFAPYLRKLHELSD